ncbi:hypothetical protein MTO96_004961 [Rhipicephalus appendiculatus]
MPFVIGRMYVEKNFNVSAKNDVEEMIKNITTTFKESLSSRPWMTWRNERNSSQEVAENDKQDRFSAMDPE